MKALDLSFSASNVTPEWCAARIRDGITLLVVNLWAGGSTIPGAEHALRTWREAGGLTAAYFVVQDFRPVEEHFSRAKANAGAEWERLQFVSVDAEQIREVEDAIGRTVSIRTVLEAVELVRKANKRPCIYTGKGFWAGPNPPFMGNPDDCAHLPLWYAAYDGRDVIEKPDFGGWTVAIGHQYTNTTNLDGIQVDFDTFDDAFVRGTAAMTDEQRTKLETAYAIAQTWAEFHKKKAKDAGRVGDAQARKVGSELTRAAALIQEVLRGG